MSYKPPTLAQMEVIREKDTEIRSKIPAPQPAPIVYEDKVFIVVSRCVDGPQGWKGLFRVCQMVQEGKRNIRKTIAEGVDMPVIMSSIETALRKRVYK